MPQPRDTRGKNVTVTILRTDCPKGTGKTDYGRNKNEKPQVIGRTRCRIRQLRASEVEHAHSLYARATHLVYRMPYVPGLTAGCQLRLTSGRILTVMGPADDADMERRQMRLVCVEEA